MDKKVKDLLENITQELECSQSKVDELLHEMQYINGEVEELKELLESKEND